MAVDCFELQRKHWDEDDRHDSNTIVDNGEVVEEEALSFSNLPVELDQKQWCKKNEENCSNDSESEFEFGLGFRSRSGSVSTKSLPEMCAADELFFGGRILPLRCRDSPVHSFTKKSMDEAILSPNGSVSRIHVVDSGSISWATSMSSRSSSKGSQQSSISGSSCGTLSSISSQFSLCSSPSPRAGFVGSNEHFLVPAGNKSHRDSLSLSSMWEFFRLGLVRKPDIELHNLKIRPSSNRNGCNKIIKDASMETEKKKKEDTVRSGFLGGCNYTVDSVARF